MKYPYYPGCSMHATGRSYDESIKAIAPALGLELEDVDDWNCCGATAYMSVNEVLSFSLSARNLAKVKDAGGDQVCVPCNACYTNLRKTEHYLAEFPELKAKVDTALAEGGMKYDGGVKPRHLLEVMVEDIGLDRIKAAVKKPLEGLKVAPYYGCQIVRPLGLAEHPDDPVSLDHVISALGATPTYFPMKTVCCGGSLVLTREDVALRLCRNLLLCAQQGGADCIVVACPLCQMNLDGYQKKINKRYGKDFHFPILYFTQLVGMAFGVPASELGLKRGLVPMNEAVSRYAEAGA